MLHRLGESLQMLIDLEERLKMLIQSSNPSVDSLRNSSIHENFNVVRGYPIGNLLYQSYICAMECTPINYPALLKTNGTDASRLALSFDNGHNIFGVHDFCVDQLSFIRNKVISLRNAIKKYGEFRF